MRRGLNESYPARWKKPKHQQGMHNFSLGCMYWLLLKVYCPFLNQHSLTPCTFGHCLPRPNSHQIELPGNGFVDFWSQGQKIIKSNLLGMVLPISGAKARKSSNQRPGTGFLYFWSHIPESRQIEPPGIGVVDFWSQGQKVIKSSLVGLVLSTPGAKARKSCFLTFLRAFN